MRTGIAATSHHAQGVFCANHCPIKVLFLAQKELAVA
jgi:hypothetical protein